MCSIRPSHRRWPGLLALAALQLTACSVARGAFYAMGALAAVAQAGQSASPASPSPLPRAEALLSLTDLAARDAATLRGERLDDTFVAAVSALPAFRACVSAHGNGRRVFVRWVVQGAAVTHVRARTSPEDPALAACVARAVSARGVFPAAAHRRVYFAALPDASPPPQPPPAGATAPDDAVMREAQARACASLRGPAGSTGTHVTVHATVADTGEVIHAWHDPTEAGWAATARCVVGAALSWRLEHRPGASFREVELPFSLAGEAPPEATLGPTMGPLAVERLTLPNGLRVTVAPIAGASTVAVHVTYGVGARDDPDGNVSLAHVTAHIAADARRAGGDGIAPALDAADVFHELVDDVADETRFVSVGPAEALERMLWAERERMAFTVGGITEAIVGEARDRVRREAEATPMAETDVLPWVYPAGHPMLRAAQRHGAADRVGTDAVRWFLQRWYRPTNAHIVVAGDVEVARATALVSRYFAEVRVSGPEGRRDALPPRRPQASSLRARISAPLPSLHLMWAAPPRCSRDELEVTVATRLLSRRIADALTGSNLVRDVASPIPADLSRIDVALTPGASPDAVLPDVERIHREASDGGFRRDEIASQQGLMAREIARNREDPESLARALARCPSGEDPGGVTVASLLPILDAQSLQRALRTWLPTQHRVVVRVDASTEAAP